MIILRIMLGSDDLVQIWSKEILNESILSYMRKKYIVPGYNYNGSAGWFNGFYWPV